MSDNVVQVKLEATYGQFQGAFAKAKEFMSGVIGGMKAELKEMSDQAKVDSKNYESTVEQFANVVQNRFKGVNGAIAGVKTAWAQLGVVIGAAAAMGRAVNDAVQYTTENQKLARALGITTNAASALSLAIGDVHGTTDEYLNASKGLDQVLRKNEKGLNDMGLVTRNSNGELRNQQDLMMDALAVLRGYKEGTDRNLAAQTMFGASFKASNELLSLNAEHLEAAKEKAESLNLVVGAESVEATNAYRAAMGDLGDVFEAMKVAVGNALMPVLTDLGKWFAEIGPTAILAIRIALNILIALFRGLALAVRVVWEVVVAAFKSMTDVAGTFGEVFSKIMSGDFAGAQAASQALFGKFATNAREAFDTIVDAAADAGSKTVDSFANILTPQKTSKTGDGEGKSYTNPAAADKAAKDAAAAAARAQREREKALREEFRAFQETKRQELEISEQTFAERLRIAKEVADKAKALFGVESSEFRKASLEILKIERELAEERKRIKEVYREQARDAAMFEVELAEQNADYLLATHQVSEQRRIQMQMDFEDQRFEIALKFLQERLALMNVETEAYAQQLAQIEALKQQHDLTMRELSHQASIEQKTPFMDMMESMRQGWANVAAQALTGQMTARQALAAIWKQMLQSFIQFLTAKLAASKLFAALEIGVGKMIAFIMRALGFKSATDAVSAKSGETNAKITQSAAAAGAGAADSQASIPYIGPILAIAAMAAIFAAVMGMKSKASSVPSAAQGFDIPGGVNPLTQLHEREMVLPEAQSDVIRGLAESGGGGGAAINIQIHAVDAPSVRRLLLNNTPALAEAIRAAARNGHALKR